MATKIAGAEAPLTAPAAVDSAAIGPRIQSLRARRGLSLRRLAALADLTAGFLSQVERGLAQPSVSSIARLSEALGVPMREVFRIETPVPSQLVRKDTRIRRSFAGMQEELISAPASEQLQVAMWTFAPGGSSGDGMVTDAPGEECIFVLGGDLQADVGVERYRLQAGDSLTFQCATPHRLTNMAEGPTTVLIAHSPPSF